MCMIPAVDYTNINKKINDKDGKPILLICC